MAFDKTKTIFKKVLGKSFRYVREEFHNLIEIFNPEMKFASTVSTLNGFK